MVNVFYEAHACGDFESINNYLSEEIEWHVWAPEELPIGGLFRDHSGVQIFLKNHKLMFKMEADEQLGVYVNRSNVAVHGYERVTIMPSGKRYEAGYVLVITVIDGKSAKDRL